MLYTLRYKEPPDPQQQTVLIEAADDREAQAIGEAWCGQNAPPPGSLMGHPRRYLSTRKAVVADRSILTPEPVVNEQDWMAKTAVARLAEMSGKTIEQVRRDLREQREGRPVYEAPAEAEAPEPVGVAAKVRQAFRDSLVGRG